MTDDSPEYIINHKQTEEGETIYYVKWVGYDITDNTWETEENMEKGWPKILEKYKKELESGMKVDSKVPKVDSKTVYEYTNSLNDWDSEVDKIVYIEKSKVPGYIVYIDWKNGYKSIHHSTEVYRKCPQKMIEYYEKLAKFNEIFIDE